MAEKPLKKMTNKPTYTEGSGVVYEFRGRSQRDGEVPPSVIAEDLSDLFEVSSDLGKLKAEEMTSVTQEVLDARLETIETRMDGRISTLEAKIDGKFADMKADIHKGTAELIKWVVGTAIAMAAVSLTVMTFVLNNAVPKAPPAPTSQPAPIIVYAQPAPSPATVPAPTNPPAPSHK